MWYYANRIFNRAIFLASTFFLLHSYTYSQCKTQQEVWSIIISIENDEVSTPEKKLKQAVALKKEYEDCLLPQDSVYARLLHRVAALEYINNKYIATGEAVALTLKSITINKSGQKNASASYAINSYYNLATFYKTLNFYNKALAFYDTVIALGTKQNSFYGNLVQSRVYKADIFFKNGDYQKCIDECTYGLPEAKAASQAGFIMELFNRRSQSYAYLNLMHNAMVDVDSAQTYAGILHADFELATTLKIKAEIYSANGQYEIAESLLNRAVVIRMKTNENDQVSDDFTDLGNFYAQKMGNHQQAVRCYTKTIDYAIKSNDAERMCKGYINLAEVFSHINKTDQYVESEKYYLKALQVYGINQASLLQNPGLNKLSTVSNIELLLTLLSNKTDLLLKMYKINNRKEYIAACVETALIMDSAVVQARRLQNGEQSKLYWRNKTRTFFANALEACYLSNNMKMAFYFMEKSRAVLLNDKLNELNASIHLPEEEANNEQAYLLSVLAEKKRLRDLNPGTDLYDQQQIKAIKASTNLEQYAKKLEIQYPLYYQYKYADDIPSLTTLQSWLDGKDYAFVHYFIQDTTLYMLAVESNNVKMIKKEGQSVNAANVNTFIKLCADKQQLNNQYKSFLSLSHTLYQIFFAPLQLTSKRIILCQDNFLLPFEALSANDRGNRFLVYDYIFSYVYSAGYLLKTPNHYPPAGNFVGFAPVSFQSYLAVPDLKNAAQSLKNSASHYGNTMLFSYEQATKSNFMRYMADYCVVNVFSHALADTVNQEPVLYMQDSIINLSELQLIHKPATQLVMLSACQTNVGRNATGEGIYSLARGFASAGIPAVSATLWKADEEAVYIITKKFNECIARGMRKDDALQQAKLFYIQQGEKEKSLPYFWANMVLIGNGDPVQLLAQHSRGNWWLIVIIGVGVAAIIFSIRRYYIK